jgi:hypothetical protein
MLVARKNRRAVRAMVMTEPSDQCLGVVQCALDGCEAYMPLQVDQDTVSTQIDWFLENHECRALAQEKAP